MTLSVHVKHRFKTFELDAQFEAPAGITVLFGRSGSGKTTLINAVAGLVKPTMAHISLGEKILHDTQSNTFIRPHKRNLGYIFQDHRLFPHLTVLQNLKYGQRQSAQPDAVSELNGIVDLLGITALLTRRPADLSGGEAQRVSIGRALLAKPQILLADEPLAALDEPRKAEILPYFERIRDEMSVPILYVSHSAAEVARLATNVVALEEGRVLRQGSALDVLADPRISPVGASAVGAAIEAIVTEHHDDGLTELNAGGVALFVPRVPHARGASLRVRLPAADVLISRERPQGLSALNVIHGTVQAVHGVDAAGAMLSLSTPAGLVLARITRRSIAALELSIGTECFAIVKTVAIASGTRD